MQEFLSYPWDSQYPTSSYSSFHNAASAHPNMPTYGNLTEGTGAFSDAGFIWQYDVGGTTDGDVEEIYRRNLTGTGNKRGFGYTYNSNAGINLHKWFDIGAEGGNADGSTTGNYARSSWMKGVTACWFCTNNYGMDNSDDCHATIKQVAIRYVNPGNNRKVIFLCPEKLAGFNYDAKIASGNVPTPCGYSLSPSDKFNVLNSGYIFLGFRIQLFLGKAGGVRSRTISFHLTGLTPGFQDSSLPYDKDNKRVICRSGGTTLLDYSNNVKFQIEAR